MILPDTWSYSAIRQLLGVCGLQYQFERIEKLEPEKLSIEMIVGSAVHHAHAFARVLQKRGQQVHVDDLRQVFAESWSIMTADPRLQLDDPARQLQDGLRLVDVLHENLSEEEILAVEDDFEVPLIDSSGDMLDRPLVGVIDLVVRDAEGRTVIVDLKTAARAYSEDKVERDLQATAYTYAGSNLFGGPQVFRFDVLMKKVKPTFERHYTTRGPADFDRLIALVRVAEKMVEAGVFVPADVGSGFFCAGCGFKTACAAWGRATAARPEFTTALGAA